MGVELDEQTALRKPEAGDRRITPRRTEVGTNVRRLLVAYSETLDAVQRLPACTMVAMGWRWRSPRGAPLHLPRLSLTAYSQTVRHIDRVLLAAERSLLRRVAVGIGGDDDAEALEAVTALRASLPSRSWVLRTSVLVIFVLGVARVLASLVPKTGISLPIYTGHKIAGPSIDHLFDGTLGVLNPDSSSIGSAVDSLFKASFGTLAVSAMLLIVAAYLVLRPAMSAFRLKRLMFNLYPHAERVLHEVPASWSVSRATGVYALEREAFAALGARMPGEVPLDLIVPLPVVLAYIGLIVAALVSASHEPESSGLGGLIFAGFFYCVPGAIRIAWLAAAWRARRGGPRSLLLATEVAVPWRSRPVRCRSPVLIAYMALTWFFPGHIWAWWWMSRDLRDRGRAHRHKAKRLEKLCPVLDALLAFLLLIPWSPPWLAPRRVRAAQSAIGIERPISRWVVVLLVMPPLLWFVVQRQINRLWEAEGTPLDTSEAIVAQMHALSAS